MQPQAGQDEADGSLVLIVEDERYARRALSLLLQHCGYQTRAAASAEEALEILEETSVGGVQAPAVALVDYNLPGVNGVDFIRQIKLSRPQIIPVLITSASEADVKSQEECLQFTYLAKPLEFRSLLRVLRDASRRLTAAQADTL